MYNAQSTYLILCIDVYTRGGQNMKDVRSVRGADVMKVRISFLQN